MIDALPIMVIPILLCFCPCIYIRAYGAAGMREMVAVLIATTLGAGLSIQGCMYLINLYLDPYI